MNILKNINKLRLVCFSTILIFINSNCGRQESVSTETGSLALEIIPEFNSESDEIRLKLNFKSKKNEIFLFDKEVFSVYNPNIEKLNLSLQNSNTVKLIDSIEHSQCIIENTKKMKRFFSNVQLFEGEVIQDKSVFMLGPNYDTIKISPNKQFVSVTNFMNSNRLKNEITDDTIRITYIYKATKEQVEAGYKSLIVTSNWFSIKTSRFR